MENKKKYKVRLLDENERMVITNPEKIKFIESLFEQMDSMEPSPEKSKEIDEYIKKGGEYITLEEYDNDTSEDSNERPSMESKAVRDQIIKKYYSANFNDMSLEDINELVADTYLAILNKYMSGEAITEGEYDMISGEFDDE